MFYYDDTGYIPARPIFYLETVLPPAKRMQPLSAEMQSKSRSRTHNYREVQWKVADSGETQNKSKPILFWRRPWQCYYCSPIIAIETKMYCIKIYVSCLRIIMSQMNFLKYYWYAWWSNYTIILTARVIFPWIAASSKAFQDDYDMIIFIDWYWGSA